MIGTNGVKRGREEVISQANKRESLNPSLISGAIQKDCFNAASATFASAFDCSNNDKRNNDEMDLDDEGGNNDESNQKDYNVIKNNLQLSLYNGVDHGISINSTYNSLSSIVPALGEETFPYTMKGGRIKYVRKIDHLVDELIRKTNKTGEWKGRDNESDWGSIPSSVGPQPQTYIRINPNDEDGDADDECDYNTRARSSSLVIGQAEESFKSMSLSAPPALSADSAKSWEINQQQQQQQYHLPQENISGSITTHSDWPMEELNCG
mmetsp:Transcript_24207/g.23262  ORF Transcript_24207/g.23262 Transcript_24207/m.23262 type:complete len:266 (-) Transcript_24207:125-922(-)